ncbi:MAG TPA: hypothetical protein VFF02_09990 [Anaeromyxobacteraceae bacterium]|nr:hypothetical protein [Anaeromyxobacteraceae bacterium]
MSLPALNRALDRAAMCWEHLRPPPAEPFRPGPAGPLRCFGPLPALPPPPAVPGEWSAPAPGGGAFAGDRLRIRCHEARPPFRGTALLLPPWKLPRASLLDGWVDLVTRSGLDAWLVIPPHHLGRAAPGARSGQGFASPDLSRLRASLEQAVLEVRVAAALARSRGPAGVVGLSLGALAGALVATAPEPLDFAALVAPPDLAWVAERTPIGRRLARLARRGGAPLPPPASLRAALEPFSALSRRPTARRLLVALGLDDVIAGREQPERLARAWGQAPRLYPRGHLTLLFACAAVRRDVAAFLRG